MLPITPLRIKSGIPPTANVLMIFIWFAPCVFLLTYLIHLIVPAIWLTNDNAYTANMVVSLFSSFLIINYLFTAKSLLTVDERGILIKITKSGLGIAKTEVFYEWTNLIKYYEIRFKGKSLYLEFLNEPKITLYDESRELFFFLQKYFPEKEQT